MSNRTVEAQKRILISLLDSNMGVNELQKQTSSDKKFVDDILRTMRKGKLIEQSKDKKHRQKMNQSLTIFGRELAELLSIVNEYKALSKRLADKIESFPRLSLRDPGKNQATLLSKGWKQDDIDDYIKNYIPYLVDSNRLRYYIERCINELFIYRYVRINKKFELNRTGEQIVDNIMSTILHEYVQTIIDYFKGMKTEFLPFFNLLSEVWDKIDRYNNKFVASEMKEFLLLMDRTFIPMHDILEDINKLYDNVLEHLSNGNFSTLEMTLFDQYLEKFSNGLKTDKSKLI